MQYRPNEKALKPLMEALEAKRRSYLSFRQKAKKLYGLPMGLLVFYILIYFICDTPLSLFLLFCFCLLLFIKFKKVDTPAEDYNNNYKEDLIKPFVPIFYPEVTYLPGKFSTSNNIQASFLYEALHFKKELSCEDGFRGKTTQGLSFTMMEVSYRLDMHGKMETKRELFISIELPNKGYRPVIVAPWFKMQQVLERYNEKMTTEEPIVKQIGFEEHFKGKYTVYSQQEEDAVALLSAPFLALIQKLEIQWTDDIRFSFVEDVLHISLSSKHNFFEADLEQAVLVDTVGENLFDELSNCLSIVNKLGASLTNLELPSKERIPLPKDLALPAQNWDDSAYDHFIDNTG
jgi:ribosome-associated toxin RatA of RatAB toxin-antitoxin module